MRVFLKHIGFILLVFIGLSLLISYASLWALRQGSFYKPSFLEQQVELEALDYVVLGSSTGLTTLNTQVLDSVLGTQGLNLSMDDTALSSQYVMLQHFIASGKQVETCILSASILDYDVEYPVLSGNDYRFAPFGYRDYVQDYYSSFSERSAEVLSISNWFPMLSVGYYNTELFYPSLLSLLNSKKRNRFDAFGNYSYPEISKPSAPIIRRRALKVEFKNPYIKRIHDLCKAQNIKLIVYLPPHKQLNVHPVKTTFSIINHSTIIDDLRYFYDNVHVNKSGRQVVSLMFARDLENILK